MKFIQKFSRNLMLLLLMLGLTACQVGNSDSTDTTEDTGDLVVSLTDGDGDFLAYAVDVTSIEMTRADGTKVETLPLTTRVDFSQYVDLSELLTVAAVPVGTYVSGSMTLDFSDADIQVEVDGAAVSASVKDSDGNAITTMTVDVTLDNHGALVIAPGVPAYLTLDFDLSSSNTVDTTVTPPTVTVEPVLVADVYLEAPKDHRVRGLLSEVSESDSYIRLALRPFYKKEGSFGRFNAYVDSETNYEIDGVTYSGAAGLTQMATLELGSWTVVYGSFNVDARRFEASEVYAGSSVPGANQDSLVGVVLSRSGDQVVLSAGSIVTASGGLIFNKDLNIDLSGLTVVTRQLTQTTYTIDDISVGQRLVMIGDLSDDMNSFTPTHARMMLSDLGGTVVSVVGSEITVDLQHLNGRPMARYDFTGTGTSSVVDADWNNYQVDAGTLSLSGVVVNAPVKVRGFVKPFGTAPADFVAQTVIGLSDIPANMQITYLLGSTAPFSSSSASGMVVDLTGSIFFHHVTRGWVVTDLSSFESSPTVAPNSAGTGLFAVTVNGTVYLYTTFAEFETAISTQLANGARLKRLGANGRFDDATVTLTANSGTAVFRQP